jgi:hypothetical protein
MSATVVVAGIEAGAGTKTGCTFALVGALTGFAA